MGVWEGGTEVELEIQAGVFSIPHCCMRVPCVPETCSVTAGAMCPGNLLGSLSHSLTLVVGAVTQLPCPHWERTLLGATQNLLSWGPVVAAAIVGVCM